MQSPEIVICLPSKRAVRQTPAFLLVLAQQRHSMMVGYGGDPVGIRGERI